MIVFGVDPGTGSSSACGLVAFDSVTKDILLVRALWAIERQKPTHHRIRDIVDQAETHVIGLMTLQGQKKYMLGIESFVMKGKGGETLQRFIGAMLSKVPYEVNVVEIANTKMKRYVGGAGGADKAEVGQGVLNFFGPNERSRYVVEELIDVKSWDVIDALGIAIAALGLGRNV